jgi:hypothetical protein
VFRREARGEATPVPDGRQARRLHREAPLRRHWRPALAPVDPLWPAAGPCVAEERVPVVIGVTGHREIADGARAAVRSAVVGFFERLASATAGAPIVLLSPLAEGADRLAAHCFLDLFGTAGTLVAPLPLDPDEYRRDFSTPDSVAEFDALLQHALVCAPASVEPALRPDRYERVGRLVARHSHLLLALWDGGGAHGRGGTGEIVRLRLGSEGDDGIVRGGGGAVVHVHTPRTLAPDGQTPGRVRTLTPTSPEGRDGYPDSELRRLGAIARLARRKGCDGRMIF